MDRIEAALASEAVSSQLSAVGQSIARYQILERIGEGGMGCVYLAQQRTPIERTVALKLIKAAWN